MIHIRLLINIQKDLTFKIVFSHQSSEGHETYFHIYRVNKKQQMFQRPKILENPGCFEICPYNRTILPSCLLALKTVMWIFTYISTKYNQMFESIQWFFEMTIISQCLFPGPVMCPPFILYVVTC